MLIFSIYHFRARRCGDWNLLSGEHSRGHETRPAVSPPDDLTMLLDLLQSAPEGSPALDARIETVLFRLASDGLGAGDPHTRQALGDESASGPWASAVRWSEDLMAWLRLVPRDHNYSLGERDGVVWAWIQPNDDWTPGPHEMRHDHPGGSGLIVAHTLPLAMAAAVVALRALPLCRSSLTPRDDTAAERCHCCEQHSAQSA